MMLSMNLMKDNAKTQSHSALSFTDKSSDKATLFLKYDV